MDKLILDNLNAHRAYLQIQVFVRSVFADL